MSQLKLGVLLSYATAAVTLLLGLFYTPWMIALIGQSDYGLYTLAISVINLFLLDMGLGTALTRYLSKCYAEQRFDDANRYLRTAFAVYSSLALLVALALIFVYFFIDRLYSGLSQSEIDVFKSLYVIVAFYSVVSLPFMSQQSILIANEQFIALRVCELIQRLFVAGLTIACLIAGQGVYAIVAATAAGNILFILIRAVLIRRLTRARISIAKPEKKDVRELLGFSGWVAVSEMSSRCNWALAPSVLGVFSNSIAISIFGLASQLESYVYSIADAISALLMPKMTRTIKGDDDGTRLTEAMVRIGRFQLFVVGLIILGFATCGQSFIEIWLSGPYDGLWICTMLVIAPHLLLLPQSPGSIAIIASGNVKQKSLISAATTLVSLLGSCILAPSLGALGACISIGLAFALSSCLITVLLNKKLSLKVMRFYGGVYAKWIVPAVLSLIAGTSVVQLVGPWNWPSLFLCCAIFALCYIVLMLLLFLEGFEKKKLISFVGKAIKHE